MAENRLGFVEITIILLSLAFLAAYLYESEITGFNVKVETKTLTDNVNLEIKESGTYSLKPRTDFGSIKSIRISGKVIGDGEAKVYVEHKNKTYLLFDSSSPVFEEPKVTGLVISDNTSNLTNQTMNSTNVTDNINQNGEATGNETSTNNTTSKNPNKTNTNNTTNATNTNTTNATNNTNTTKQIFIHLDYKAYNSNFDTNNDGIETENGIIDLTVANTNFNWNVNENKLCTKWELNNNQGLTTTTCNGNPQCCSLLNLAPTQNRWNAPYYTYKGKNNATNNNTITAQIIYLNQNTTNNKTPLEITYSQPQSKQAIFVPPRIRVFNNSCVETCLFDGLTEDDYMLIINITNATLIIENIMFDIETLDYIPPEKRERTVYLNKAVNESIERSIQWLTGQNNIDIGSLYALHEANKVLNDQRLSTLIAEQLDRTSDFYLPYKRLIKGEPFSLSEVDERFFEFRYNSNLIPILRCQQHPLTAEFLDRLVDIRGTDEEYGYYDDLHVLLALVWMRERKCFDEDLIDLFIKQRIMLVEKKPVGNISLDMLAERLAFIQYAGYSVSSDQITTLVENQNTDGGFGIMYGEKSHPHATSHALWALAEWSNG